MYDAIIVGAGPAGISSGLYLKRANKNVLILYYGGSSLENAELINNYYGFEKGISGKELYENGIKQAKNIGIELKNEEVLDIEKQENFIVKTESYVYECKTVILATGSKNLKPNIKGINDFEGKGISYCTLCDGFFYKGKNVVVIGDGKFAVSEAENLKNIVNNVKILTNGNEIEFSGKIESINKKIKEIKGNFKVEKIEFDDGTSLDVDGIFIAFGKAGSIDFAKRMGVTTLKDNIVVDENMKTNIKGLYFCGDSTGRLLQVCKAVYEGAKAAISAVNFLNK